MKAILLCVAAAMLCGCTTVAPKVAKAVNRYCQEPFETRMLLRASVNQMTAPNSVAVKCAGDPE